MSVGAFSRVIGWDAAGLDTEKTELDSAVSHISLELFEFFFEIGGVMSPKVGFGHLEHGLSRRFGVSRDGWRLGWRVDWKSETLILSDLHGDGIIR